MAGTTGGGLSAGSLIGLGASALGGIYGILQGIKARNLEKKNVFTPQVVNPLIAQNQAQAQNQALVGLPQQQYNNTLNQQNQNLASILASASRSGRNLQLGGLLRQSNQATQNLNAADAQARQQNRGIAMQQNQILANEQQRVRNWNVDQPYLRNMQRVADLRGAGQSNLFGAVGNLSNFAMMGAFDKNGGQQTANPTVQNLMPLPSRPQMRLGNYGGSVSPRFY